MWVPPLSQTQNLVQLANQMSAQYSTGALFIFVYVCMSAVRVCSSEWQRYKVNCDFVYWPVK